MTQHSYRSHMEYTVSDHKPVAAQFILHFAFRDDVPLVRLEVADEWVRPEQAVVRYRMETVFARSSWDWIGLYRVGFRHCKDYVAYVWAKHEDVDRNIYQVLKRRRGVGGSSCYPWGLRTQLEGSWSPSPYLGLNPLGPPGDIQ